MLLLKQYIISCYFCICAISFVAFVCLLYSNVGQSVFCGGII